MKQGYELPKVGIHSPELNKVRSDIFKRYCLKCDKGFTAKGRFTRVCDECKSKKEHSEW